MKNFIYIELLMLITLFLSCTDVIDVEVPTGKTRLVIEASLDWEKGTTGENQTIKLSTTTPYFDSEKSQAVTGAQVVVTRVGTQKEIPFTDNNDGTYSTTDFEAVLNETYALHVIYNNEIYTATETLLPTAPISRVTQSMDNGLLSDVFEVNVFFQDPETETNFYVLKFQEQGDPYPELRDVSDEFLNGNEINIFYEKYDSDDEEEEFQPGDVVAINLYNVSERYYKYIQLLNSQLGSGNPFAPTPVELRGNCVNSTNADNYPYGYFRVTEADKKEYTFVEDTN